MADKSILAVTMPKWGLAMKEGKVGDWLIGEGEEVDSGDELVDVETDKIASAVEAAHSGILRRRVAVPGEVLPVGALLGVLAGSDASGSQIDSFVADFQENFVPEETGEEDQGPETQSVETGTGKINYLRQGEAEEAAVLLHGFGGDLNNWLFNHPALSAERSVYAFDLPGHGGSSKKVGDGSVVSLAETLHEACTALGIEKADWVGHSMGGALALQTVKVHPESVRSLTLIAGAGLGSEINSDYLKGFTGSQSRRELKPHIEQLFNDPGLVTRQLLEDLLRFKRIDGVQGALQTIMNSFVRDGQQTEKWRDVLENKTIPAQVIWGATDRIIPSAHARGLPRHVQVQVLENYGHMVQMEGAAEVNRMILQFWQS